MATKYKLQALCSRWQPTQLTFAFANIFPIFRMKKIILALLFQFITLLLYAQGDKPTTLYDKPNEPWRAQMVGKARNYLRLSVGLALPQGSYASIYEKEQAGYSKVGTALGIDAAFHLTRNFGITTTLSGYYNPINKVAYLNDLEKQLPNNLANPSLVCKGWLNVVAAVGPSITLPEKKFVFDLGLLVGANFGQSPNIEYRATNESGDVVFRQLAKNAVGVAVVLHTGISIPLSTFNKWSVFAKGDMIGSLLRYKTMQQAEAIGYKTNSEYGFKQNVTSFNLCIGISRQFGYAPNSTKLPKL